MEGSATPRIGENSCSEKNLLTQRASRRLDGGGVAVVEPRKCVLIRRAIIAKRPSVGGPTLINAWHVALFCSH